MIQGLFIIISEECEYFNGIIIFYLCVYIIHQSKCDIL